jgi:hypothetical protein
MSGFGKNPTTTTQTVPPTNQIFLSSVAVPDHVNADLTALRGANAATDINGNEEADASVAILDGHDVTQGTSTDAAVTSDTNGTQSGKLRGLVKIFADIWDSVNHRIKVDASGTTVPVSGTFFQTTQPVSGTVTSNAGTNLNTSALALEAGHLATIDSHIPAPGQALAAGSMPVVLTAAQITTLTPPVAITGFALEAGHLATIDTSTAASKTDLDSIVTNTNKIPASPAQEGGNLATLAGIVSSAKAATKAASGDFADGAIVGIGTTTQTKATDGTTTSWSVIQLLKGIFDKLLGSIAVTGTFWQTTQPVSGTITETNSAASKADLDTMVPGVQGWIAATGTGTATTDDSFTFANQVRKVVLYNSATVAVPFEFDQTATANSFPIQPGQYMVFDSVLCTVVHVFPSVTLTLNTAGGLYVKGWK